jgi:hypothetical protein
MANVFPWLLFAVVVLPLAFMTGGVLGAAIGSVLGRWAVGIGALVMLGSLVASLDRLHNEWALWTIAVAWVGGFCLPLYVRQAPSNSVPEPPSRRPN